MKRMIGIGDFAVSADPADVLVTYSLGSCIALSLYDPVARLGGMVHCMMPLSRHDPVKADRRPAMYVDTGVLVLLRAVFEAGARRKRLVARAAGASHILDGKGVFRIGQRNAAVLRRLLWKNDLLLRGEDLGGMLSRTMSLHVANGLVTVRSGRHEWSL